MTPHQILKTYWGHDQFRPAQLEIIQAILDGKDTLAILPTGGGKSICFQVPTMVQEGLCLVISPLIALMEDQVNRLKENEMPAAALVSGMKLHEQDEVLAAAENNEIKFLYVSPERLQSKSFIASLHNLPISLIAVDEAHCISQWGYDFRPAYLNIATIRAQLANVPLIALTASATAKVKEDIQEKLLMKSPSVFMTSFSRKNLSYHVEESADKISRIVYWIKKLNGSGIVYCKTRRRTKEISDLLNGHFLKSDFYHAGLDQETRKEKQQRWINGATPIMVCTNAFGMGIDKGDVRFVIHADVPDCLENYYQEAGRAGRDGNSAYAILLFKKDELDDLKLLPDVKFPNLATLRKIYHALCNYFQLPIGLGKGDFFPFLMEDFLLKFKLDSNEVVHSLHALKQEEIISYLEKTFTPSSVQVVSDRSRIEDFETKQGNLEPIIKALLRTYGGVFDGPVNINETQLAWILKRDIISIKEQLIALHHAGIINYLPKNDQPQIGYLHDRVRTDDLDINHENYLRRKKEYAGRITNMIEYIQTDNCKSVFIGQYFGDSAIVDCDICDNCAEKKLQKKRELIIPEIMETILSEIKDVPKELETLKAIIEKDDMSVMKAISFLAEEQKIKIYQDGRIGLK
jgi:ATP-dependent DNA helicase RecQ